MRVAVGGGLDEELREEAGERRDMCSLEEREGVVEDGGGAPCDVGLKPLAARSDCRSYGRNPGCPNGN